MNDQIRVMLMMTLTSAVALGAGFGLNITGEQVSLITAFGTNALLLAGYFWKDGQSRGPGGQPNLPPSLVDAIADSPDIPASTVLDDSSKSPSP